MKKISILLISLLALISACDMDKFPYHANEETIAIQSVADCESYRNGLYVNFRALFSGSYLLYPMIQSDEFHAIYGFSGTAVEMYMWDLHSNSGIFTSYWGSYYGIIASANFLIQECDKLLVDEGISEQDKAAIRVYQGEAYFLRAFSYNELALRFCNDYEPSSANSDMGLPLVTTYAPTPDGSSYPGRSSLEETFQRITDDLQYASEQVTTKGIPNSPYVTKDVVNALKARVALEMHDYETAATLAAGLVASQTYQMDDVNNGGLSSFQNMWANDKGTEVLWQIQCDANQPASSTITYFLGIVEGAVDFIPESYIVNGLYDNENDIRFKTYFKYMPINTALGNEEQYAFAKYPGNVAYNPGGLREKLFNSPKIIRMAEMYLIAAEAYAQVNGGEVNANKYLNALRSLRIEGWKDQQYTGSLLKTEIQTERFREFFGENMRMTDLKRWHQGVVRSAAQNSSFTYLPGNDATENLSKNANDYMMTWAIPQSEIDVNPQLEGQQNPGY